MANYYEPAEAPKTEETRRTIRVRFKTKEDVLEFERKTGIKLSHRKLVRLEFPIDDVFG